MCLTILATRKVGYYELQKTSAINSNNSEYCVIPDGSKISSFTQV